MESNFFPVVPVADCHCMTEYLSPCEVSDTGCLGSRILISVAKPMAVIIEHVAL